MPSYRWTRAAVLVGTFVATAAGASPTRAQAPAPIKVSITVAGRTETLRGTGQCGHEPRASLHGASAALWLVQYAGTAGSPGLSLSYWRLAAAGAEEPQFSLAVAEKKASHRISTIKGGELAGSGRATFRPTATGGRFEIAGTAQDGSALQVTIECARFGGIYAEGG